MNGEHSTGSWGCVVLSPVTWAAACILWALIGTAHGEEYKRFRLGGFSPDGERLVLSYCTDRPICKVGYFDLRLQAFSELAPQDIDQIWSPGSFSPDGTQIVFSIRRKSENERFAQIGILELGTRRLTELTSTLSYKSSPSFSHDGKMIIFAQSNRAREAGHTKFSDWDIYEIGRDGKDERQLTAFRFFAVTPPSYLPGDRQFIFAGDNPHGYVSPTGEAGYKAYQTQFRENRIFVLSIGSESRLAPYFTNGEMSDLPLISFNGAKIVYTTRTDKLDGILTRFTYDLFFFDEGGKHTRLTRLDGLISDAVLSADGSTVALVVQPHKRLDILEPLLLDVHSGRIDSLDPARIGWKRTTGR